MDIYELTELNKLNGCAYEVAKASRWKEQTQRYISNMLINNIHLQQELRNGTYKLSPTNDFTLSERGKRRYIKAPAIRDRIVQKLLCKYVLVPQLRKYLIYDNYASLEGRGTALARKRLDIAMREHIRQYGTNGYILQIDIRKYFDSISHNILKEMIHGKVQTDKAIFDLIDMSIDSSSDNGIGINLGSEVPQILAVFYLYRLDNYIKAVKSVKHYGRYMDDMYIISESKEKLWELLNEIKVQLAELKLEVNPKKTHIVKLSHGFTYLQIKYSISDSKIIKRPVGKKITRERRRLKKFKQIGMPDKEIVNCYKSWRNTTVKDCNACKRSVQKLDSFAAAIAPKSESVKLSRTELINNIFEEMKT